MQLKLTALLLFISVSTVCAQSPSGIPDHHKDLYYVDLYDDFGSAASINDKEAHKEDLLKHRKIQIIRQAIDLKGKLRQQFTILTVSSMTSMSNMVGSPISALLPLGKLAMGSIGKTFKELSEAIGVNTHSEVEAAFVKLIQDIGDLPGVTMDLINRLYINKGYNLLKPFEMLSNRIFNSSVNTIDFEKNYEAVKEINEWVTAETHGKIREILSPGKVSKASSIVIVNAAYFTGRWLYQFESVETGIFFTPKGGKEVKMMSTVKRYPYYMSGPLDAQVHTLRALIQMWEGVIPSISSEALPVATEFANSKMALGILENTRIISIPFESPSLSMVVVLPTQTNGLPTLLSQLKVAPDILVPEVLKTAARNYVKVTLPIFHIETQLDLKEIYQKIGLRGIFSSSDGIEGMAIMKKLTVSAATQKNYIDVNEWGVTNYTIDRMYSYGI